jgi:hypothetical protein
MSGMRAAPGVDPDEARRRAQQILSDRRFRSSPTPRPLRGPLQWLGDRISSLLGHLADLVSASSLIWIGLLATAIALIVWFVARQLRRRPARAAAAHAARATTGADTETADELEREADAAERDGDLARALRLRFRAGLLRLGDRGAIAYRPSVTTGEVRRVLDSRRFDDLAGTFEAVTYGGRAADPPAVDTARREWPHVLEDTAPSARPEGSLVRTEESRRR